MVRCVAEINQPVGGGGSHSERFYLIAGLTLP